MTLEPHHFLHLKCDRLTSSTDEQRKPKVGSVSDPSRTVDARLRGRPVDGPSSARAFALRSGSWSSRAVSKYMVRGGSPSQGWKTFFRNHAHAIAAIDLLVVPTLTFERLFAFLVLGHGHGRATAMGGPRP